MIDPTKPSLIERTQLIRIVSGRDCIDILLLIFSFGGPLNPNERCSDLLSFGNPAVHKTDG